MSKVPERKLRVMWSSNSPWASSGYSNQTRDLLYRFLKEGWHVACSCFYGLEGGIIEVDGLRCYPKLGDMYGADAAQAHSKDFAADITIPFQDAWVMNPENLRGCARYVPYVPIDFDPAPPPVIQRMQLAYRIITYSKFGQKALQNQGFHSTMIPHGVDTKRFVPMDKLEARKHFGLPPDRFFFGMVAANKDNPPRKEFQRVLDAFAQYKRNHREAALYIHTIMGHPQGFPIMEYANHLGVANDVFYLDNYKVAVKITHDDIAKLMAGFDVLLAPSNSEGFGMPIIESQAVGVPVITTDFTSMPELIIPEETGLLTKVEWKRYVPIHAYAGHPSTDDLYANMEKITIMDRKAMGVKAREHILKNYDIDFLVKSQWNPFFESVERDVYKEVK